MSAHRFEAVAVGGSAGALEALSTILPMLPHDYPLPVLVVMHLPPDRKSALVEVLRTKCRIDLREAEDKEPVQGGTVYFAPPDYHLLVEKHRHLALSGEEPVLFSRPSIDVLFETAADAFGAGLIAVVLTGASSDGARGLKAAHEAGGVALVQRPDLAHVAAMPFAALAACPAARALSLTEIGVYLLEAITTA